MKKKWYIDSEHKLGIEGENLKGIYSSRKFVNWYNGHPYFVNAINESDFNNETAVIIGNGNVSIDCARILGSNMNRLKESDITNHALNIIGSTNNKIREIYLIGRRACHHGSFTNKELREIIDGLEGCYSSVLNCDLVLSKNENIPELKERIHKRKIEILERGIKNENITLNDINKNEKIIHFRFMLSPIKFIADINNERVKSVILQRNKLINPISNKIEIIKDDIININCGLILNSIGYKGINIDNELSWNNNNNIIDNDKGKVINKKNIYVSGWIKRGPKGIIGTNIPDAQETINSLINDWDNNLLDKIDGRDNIVSILKKNNIKFIDKNGWEKIDKIEVENGLKIGKPREKFVDIEQMIDIAYS